MAPQDPYQATDRLDADILRVIADRLEIRARHPFFQGMLRDYLGEMGIEGAGRVLDIGCGTGVAARGIAGRPGFAGRVVGIDLSPFLVETARRLAAEAGVGEAVSFRTGDIRALDEPDASFDAAVAHTLLGHVADPRRVLSEIARVVRPGGLIATLDGDFVSMTFAQEDTAKWKADDEKMVGAIAAQPLIARQLPRIARDAGLDLVRVLPFVLAEAGRADYWVPAIQSLRALIPNAGLMTEDEAGAWHDDLMDTSEQGVFFGAVNYYAYILRRP